MSIKVWWKYDNKVDEATKKELDINCDIDDFKRLIVGKYHTGSYQVYYKGKSLVPDSSVQHDTKYQEPLLLKRIETKQFHDESLPSTTTSFNKNKNEMTHPPLPVTFESSADLDGKVLDEEEKQQQQQQEYGYVYERQEPGKFYT
ncbi:unnamed protein product [Didymodactylos carnosus]|uniref:Uncharacterized protein n=1 Tax=Didymodactylos carnosus TaxID=1234261 RepID=A0A8S2GFK7_9BILA|nr:unnamed protein product [Didymodactylos carnosus]CAF3509821.1 unnamed protein product [Didymodactylos carnosus]